MSEPTYRPWDREEKLGPPPWSNDDPKLIAWEEAHGHDVRLKCYPEFGCQALEEYHDRIEAAAREAVEAFLKYDYPSCSPALGAAMVRLKEALGDE